MIKYLGSKRRLVDTLSAMAVAAGARTALDLFTGTTRVAQGLKRRGITVTAVDRASYAHVLAECYVATDALKVDHSELDRVLRHLASLPGRPGYVTDVFCRQSRFFQPHNGARIDAVRAAIEDHRDSWLYPVLLTSLLEAADRVDSTTGLQMAYLKQWAPRSFRDLELRTPTLLAGAGLAMRGDATGLVHTMAPVDLAYLDPPYNQHRYESNYHVWETLVRWDEPEHYGTACKRVDIRDSDDRSAFNSRRTLPAALRRLIGDVRAQIVLVSYNDESWVSREQMTRWLLEAGHDAAQLVEFDSTRYVGAQIGIHDPQGRKVGKVGRTRNVEWVFVAGDADRVERACRCAADHGGRTSDTRLAVGHVSG